MTPHTDEQIIWTGDLDDDCTAQWRGLMLRAEWIDGPDWWWAVSEIATGSEIGASNDFDTPCVSGSDARSLAEIAARDHIGRQGRS
jgi:hypothetical protein